MRINLKTEEDRASALVRNSSIVYIFFDFSPSPVNFVCRSELVGVTGLFPVQASVAPIMPNVNRTEKATDAGGEM